MSSAQALYTMFTDLDNADYTETLESDLAFITALIQEIGYRDAKATLKAMFE